MAGSGPAPKPDDQRRRRNAPTHGAERVLKDDGVLRGPELVEVAPSLPEDSQALDYVLGWWDDWRRSPQAQTFLATDWRRLGMLSALVAAYFAQPDTKLLSELRLNEERLGALHVDRLKARIRVEPAETAPVVSLASAGSARDRFRDRLEEGS